MTHHFEQKTLPFAPQQLFDLVADVERYPEFLPWCQSVRIRARQGDCMEADLTIGYKSIRETFTSLVTLSSPHLISVRYGGGPLKHLSNEWRFEATEDKQGCLLSFYVDFAIRSLLLSGLMDAFFDKAFTRMVGSFEKRAQELYGTGVSPRHVR